MCVPHCRGQMESIPCERSVEANMTETMRHLERGCHGYLGAYGEKMPPCAAQRKAIKQSSGSSTPESREPCANAVLEAEDMKAAEATQDASAHRKPVIAPEPVNPTYVPVELPLWLKISNSSMASSGTRRPRPTPSSAYANATGSPEHDPCPTQALVLPDW
mmetsp:Transcript_108019/g.315838  ORF Transcript_108019/g.315838 Transcript_108019/m.315838 type:complete len:161 (+) Transcript_108019:91-573(+)